MNEDIIEAIERNRDHDAHPLYARINGIFGHADNGMLIERDIIKKHTDALNKACKCDTYSVHSSPGWNAVLALKRGHISQDAAFLLAMTLL